MIITRTFDCHAHAYDGEDGYMTLIQIAETYGVLIHDATEDEVPAGWLDWADWYTITGPLEHVRRFIIEEYTGGDERWADELIGSGESI